MGRKERRLAAKIGTGRRVKLDLFADEPSGDLGGSSPKDDVEKDVDGKHDPELPNSPSSGHRPENPLSLLGQYSDDELDDVSNKAEGENNNIEQDKESIDNELEDGEIGGSEAPSDQKAGDITQEGSVSASASLVVDADYGMTKMVNSEENNHGVDGGKQDPAPFASDVQSSDLSSSWKMVLHEESKSYYYWNTVTGETSWEIPESLVQGASSTTGLESSRTDVEGSPPGDVNNTIAFGPSGNKFSASHGVCYTSGISQMKMVYEHADQKSQVLEQSINDSNQLLGNSLVGGALPCETSTLSNYILPEQYTGAVGSLTMGSYEVHGHSVLSGEQSVHLPSQLAKQSETLLEKLKLMLGSSIDSDRHAILSKYILVIEVRISDIRALLPYGSAVLPFWVHTERQLNELESFINTQIGDSGIMVNGTYTKSSEVTDSLLKGTCGGMNVDENLTEVSPEVSAIVANDMDVAPKISPEKASDGGILNVAETSVSSPTTCSRIDKEGAIGVRHTESHAKVSSKLELQISEDVDMDIDMDVEVPSPSRNRTADTGGQLVDISEPLAQPSTSLAVESVTQETEFSIPPLPEEEWIPPPPPDDEGIPPPPPDEPPESCPPPPPSELEAVQPVYGEQYNMQYADPNVNFYGNTTVVSSGSSIYEHGGGFQSTLNHPVYLATAPQPPTMPDPADAAVFYGLQNGSLAAVPLVGTTGSSSSQVAASILGGCDSLEMTSAGAPLGSCSLPTQIVDASASSVMPGMFSSQASSTCVVSAPAILLGKEQQASVPSSSAAETAAAEASAAASKAQAKASRMKKPKVSVAASLRSNKKVSSLVDKWKAAKEELEEEEEQRETPLDFLEKKRRREIEEWRAQQIASGEAEENANFQPLGGDWRERVKRKRAKKEAAAEKLSVSVDDTVKQPDLKALSKDLPRGWQVHWDDSSKQAYYSNLATSETTWTRPTR